MVFTCEHCNKLINGMGVVYDKTHFLHPECEKDFKLAKDEMTDLVEVEE